MRTLGCLGCVFDETRNLAFLVYTFPSASSCDPPTSLFEYLVRRTRESKIKTSLDDRYVLAYESAESVFQLHLSGWLHKGIRSDNMLSFRSKDVSVADIPSGRVLREPYLTGFEFSRQDGDTHSQTVEETAEFNRYRHLDGQTPRCAVTESYTIYTDFLIVDHDVAYRVGDIYEQVVLACMGNDFEQEDENTEEFQEQLNCSTLLQQLDELVPNVTITPSTFVVVTRVQWFRVDHKKMVKNGPI
ncbi:hypothetical protein K440DRAFT_646616 [Wilcoxina mikolae CBS 423.85]|nr:hypothetical protein K440DRAFT_646616 [Wilcoxina mikolae CBS 423.85]